MKEVALCTQDSLESTSHLLCDWLREHVLSSDLTLSLASLTSLAGLLHVWGFFPTSCLRDPVGPLYCYNMTFTLS